MNEKTAHLNMISTVINRLAYTSVAIKISYIVSFAAALTIYTPSTDIRMLAFASVNMWLWIADSHFLAQERRFRKLHYVISRQSQTDFTMNTSTIKVGHVFWSMNMVIFWGVSFCLTLFVGLLNFS